MLPLLTLAAAAAEPPAATLAGAAAPASEDRTVSLKVSVVPGVGWSASPSTSVDGFATGLISMSPSLDGIDAELAGSWVDGPMTGFQGSLGFNVAGDVSGIQATSGLNWARGDVAFAQLSAGANVAYGDVRGVQGSSGLNVAGGTVRGVQVAPLNVARRIDGLQAGTLNVADEARGLQLGLVNVGRDVDGVQVGLVNFAKTSEVSIAPFNFVGDGLHRVDVWASESAVGSVAAKFGSKHVYTLIGAGWVNPSQPWWSFGGGFGVHVPAGPAWLEIDDSVWSLAAGNLLVPGVHNKLRANVGFDVTRHFAPFVGVSINTWWGLGTVAPRAVGGLPEWADSTRRYVAWPGFQAGISF